MAIMAVLRMEQTCLSEYREKGFSLVELLIAMALSGIVLGSVYGVFLIQHRSLRFQEDVTEMVGNVRAVISVMSREIKMAGYNPTRTTFDGITYNASQIEIKSDLNGNGNVEELNEHVIYSYDADSLTINRNTGGQTLPFAENIQSFAFTYLKKDGVSTTNTDQISQMMITITARTGKRNPGYTLNGGYRTFTLSSLVIPRNLAVK